jgi:hypothetical protein
MEEVVVTHPEVLATMAKQHIDDLVEEAARNRLATALRRSRRQRWPSSQRAVPTAESRPASTVESRPVGAAESVGPAGTLVLCEVRPAGAARGQAR